MYRIQYICNEDIYFIKDGLLRILRYIKSSENTYSLDNITYTIKGDKYLCTEWYGIWLDKGKVFIEEIYEARSIKEVNTENIENIIDIHTSFEQSINTLILTLSGEVFGIGDNFHWQFAHDDRNMIIYPSNPLKINNIKDVVRVWCNDTTSLFLDIHKDLYISGYLEDVNFGLNPGTMIDYCYPEKILSNIDIKDVIHFYGKIFILLENGNLYGYNEVSNIDNFYRLLREGNELLLFKKDGSVSIFNTETRIETSINIIYQDIDKDTS